MTKKLMIVLTGLTLSMACATQVSIMPTYRDDVAAEAPVLADEARNLVGVARNQFDLSASVADAIADFHTAAENFAAEATRETSQDETDTRYEELIRAWVRVKLVFPVNKASGLLKQSYDQVAREWEKLEQATGDAGKQYQKKYEGQ